VNPIAATWPLLLGMGILMLGAGLQSTLLGVRATIEAFPTPITGVVMSCYYVGYLLGTRLAPQLLRRVGPVRVFATLAALASVAVLVHGAWVHPGPWAMMRLLSGVCFAGIYVVWAVRSSCWCSRVPSRPSRSCWSRR
jgi:MFS family permease